MFKSITVFSLAAIISAVLAFSQPSCALADTIKNDFYALNATLLNGTQKQFSAYRGKVVLVINIALQCGTTPQLRALQELADEFGPKGLEILAFPSNDFTGENLDNTEIIQSFCTNNYSISFPIFSPGPVKGASPQAVFAFLTQQSPSDLQGEVEFNFEKFLIDRGGKVRARYGSFTSAQSQVLKNKLKDLITEEQ